MSESDQRKTTGGGYTVNEPWRPREHDPTQSELMRGSGRSLARRLGVERELPSCIAFPNRISETTSSRRTRIKSFLSNPVAADPPPSGSSNRQLQSDTTQSQYEIMPITNLCCTVALEPLLVDAASTDDSGMDVTIFHRKESRPGSREQSTAEPLSLECIPRGSEFRACVLPPLTRHVYVP